MAVTFFQNNTHTYLVQSSSTLRPEEVGRLTWLLEAKQVPGGKVKGRFVGPRREMVTPWSTNATEIARNIGLTSVERVEEFLAIVEKTPKIDPMLQVVYDGLQENLLEVSTTPEPTRAVTDIAAFNETFGLALSREEIDYLNRVSAELGRPLTDAEIYGFSQINSEHCRHKIFNGQFIIDDVAREFSLFDHIKETSKQSGGELVSAYKDNVAFFRGPRVLQFAPRHGEQSGEFELCEIDSVLSLKAETHNFPTTVEPFYGASTGSGGEIRDRMAGGTGSIPLVGTAVYMTAYPRLEGSRAEHWERCTSARPWKYQTPLEILVKASNGASDFGNKFGQPIVVGSLLTFEGESKRGLYGYDRCVMLAGGVGYANAAHAQKKSPAAGDVLLMMGGDNYRIGMAGGSVSSVDTGVVAKSIELSAVQRANPEMQKRTYNVVRAMTEAEDNAIISIHDHGAGGHVNCFTELVEPLGGQIAIDALPVGDPTLSALELLCNESQERMGLIVPRTRLDVIQQIARRERSPLYVLGEITGDEAIVFEKQGSRPFALPLHALLGSSPKTILRDRTVTEKEPTPQISIDSGEALRSCLEDTLSLEGVACKDWLTNKVDRSVTGRVAQQQCVGPLQLPLSNVGVVALDYSSQQGIATAIGHAPVAGLIDEVAGSVLSVAESLTNLVWAPLEKGLASVVLSANWMWPAKQPGEDARLYRAVEGLAKFCIELGIPVPTGKDSLSMTMKYADGKSVRAPGTVIVTAAAHCSDNRKVVTPNLVPIEGSVLLYVNLSGQSENFLGGSSFFQTRATLGDRAPTVTNVKAFKAGFDCIQQLVKEEKLLAGHDISSGGLLTAAAEMCFAGDCGVELNAPEKDLLNFMFCEKPAVLLQVEASRAEEILRGFSSRGVTAINLGIVRGKEFTVEAGKLSFTANVSELRKTWCKPSYLLDRLQTAPALAEERFRTFETRHLTYKFPEKFSGTQQQYGIQLTRRGRSKFRAAIIREQGTNGDRELAFSLHAAGFSVQDITMWDLVNGKTSLDDISFAVFPGGFSNSDVLGAARGWAGAFRYNVPAQKTLTAFLARPNTLSLGVCNGCQLMMALEDIYPFAAEGIRMNHNASGKFESSFLNVEIRPSNAVLLQGLEGSRLGIWVAHGEGRFTFREPNGKFSVPMCYVSNEYPSNPNNSQGNAAAVATSDGRHLGMMPHLERSILPWQWPFYPRDRQRGDEITPWMIAFANAREWISKL